MILNPINISNFQTVECSCGAKTVVSWDARMIGRDGKPGGRYVSRFKWWRFRTSEEAERTGRGIGWYCGNEAHEQKP